jgi:hypothetical protein
MDLEELQSALSESLSWRKLELQQARYLAENAAEIDLPYLCRAWTLVMYAHCDQYTKETSRLYLEFLRSNPRDSYDYWSIWQAFRAKQLMLEGSDGPSYESALRPRENDKSKLIDTIVHKTVIDSGNFSYRRFRFIMNFVLQVDFDCVVYKGFCSTLKTKRDEIAHGERSFVAEVSDCVAWHEPTLSLLDSVRDSVLNKASEA